MAEIECPGTNLKQQWRHEQEIIPTHQHDLNIRTVLQKPFQVAGRVDSTKAATKDHNAFHLVTPAAR